MKMGFNEVCSSVKNNCLSFNNSNMHVSYVVASSFGCALLENLAFATRWDVAIAIPEYGCACTMPGKHIRMRSKTPAGFIRAHKHFMKLERTGGLCRLDKHRKAFYCYNNNPIYLQEGNLRLLAGKLIRTYAYNLNFY